MTEEPEPTTVAEIVARDGDRTFLDFELELDPCGECLKGTCDDCDFCRYLADKSARGWT